ncbi:MAG: hypothetical protein R3C03_24315, partial [Pirellulaceae bacterium]
ENLVLVLDGENDALQTQVAAEMFESRGRIDYFIEVGRNEKLADEHPEWICSLQGHPEWRHKFPEVGEPGDDELVKCYPWVSVFYESAFQAHLERIKKLLANKPKPTRIWLNDLQAGPSACGCGHILCRWTTDYGPVATADKLGDDAIALFVAEVKRVAPDCEVIPILTTECEEADKECECGGVDCFQGICWRAFSKQLDFVAQDSPVIGVACFYKLFDRDLERYGVEASWVRFAVESLEKMPPMRGGKGVETLRTVAILQGWDVDESELIAQKKKAVDSGAKGWLVVRTAINQSWEPRVIRFERNVIRKNLR